MIKNESSIIGVIDKKIIKSLNDLNQDAKNIFEDYLIFHNDHIEGTNKLHKGEHFAIPSIDLGPVFENFPNKIFKFYSQILFKTISENKKYLDAFTIKDSKIYLEGLAGKISIQVGEIVSSNNITSNNQKFENIVKRELNDDFDVMLELNEDSVISLVGNEFINISEGKYRTRITKEIIPGLKKSHKIKLFFYEHPSDKSLFHMCVQAERNKLISYHIYTCLYM